MIDARRKERKMILSKNDKKVLDEVIDNYGAEMQMMMLCEECGELIQASSKMIRGVTPKRIANLKEEIADVLVMIEQAMIIFDIEDEDIVAQMMKKIERTRRRIDDVQHNGRNDA